MPKLGQSKFNTESGSPYAWAQRVDQASAGSVKVTTGQGITEIRSYTIVFVYSRHFWYQGNKWKHA